MNPAQILNLFPAPKFLNIPYAGIAISDTAIRCVQFGKSNKGLFIEKYTERPIPENAIISGFINSPQEVLAVFESLKKDLNLTYIKVSLPEEKAYLFTTKLPFVDPKLVRNTIEFGIEENVPLPASELTFDYAFGDPHGHGDHVDVIVSALPTKIVDQYVELINKVDLPILSLEIESQAMARAVLPIGTQDTNLIVHFGHDKVGLYVAYKRVVHFTSTIAIRNDLIDDPSYLSHEIEKLFTYWHTLKENVGQTDRKISKIVVCGEHVTDSIVSYFSLQHEVEAQIANVWVNAFDITKSIPPISFADSLRFTAAVGLALPSDMFI